MKNRADARLVKLSNHTQQQRDDSTALARAFEALNAFVTAEMQATKNELIQLRKELSEETRARHEAEKKQMVAESERKVLTVENEALRKQTSLLESSVSRLTGENMHLREKVVALETDLKHLRFELSGEVVGQRIMPPVIAPLEEQI